MAWKHLDICNANFMLQGVTLPERIHRYRQGNRRIFKEKKKVYPAPDTHPFTLHFNQCSHSK